MAIIRISAEQLRSPFDSETILIREECAADCEGDVCGKAYWEGGEIVAGPGPHHHLVISGENPTAAERYFAVLSD